MESMTIQEAAHRVLTEQGKPMLATEIARIALGRGWVTSTARNPMQSHANTISKNIHDGAYNKPELVFVKASGSRLIGLPAWGGNQVTDGPEVNANHLVELKARIPSQLHDKIRLAEHAKVAQGFDSTVCLLLTEGLRAVGPRIKDRLAKQLSEL